MSGPLTKGPESSVWKRVWVPSRGGAQWLCWEEGTELLFLLLCLGLDTPRTQAWGVSWLGRAWRLGRQRGRSAEPVALPAIRSAAPCAGLQTGSRRQRLVDSLASLVQFSSPAQQHLSLREEEVGSANQIGLEGTLVSPLCPQTPPRS